MLPKNCTMKTKRTHQATLWKGNGMDTRTCLVHLTMCISTNTPSPLWSLVVVAASSLEDASLQEVVDGLCIYRVKWLQPFILKSWKNTWCSLKENCGDLYCSRNVTPSIQPKLHTNGLKTMLLLFWRGQVKAQTTIQLGICGWTWNGLFPYNSHAIWQSLSS